MKDFVEKTMVQWEKNPRWNGILSNYIPEEVYKLKGSMDIEYTLARKGAERFWELLHSEEFICTLGAVTGNQAIQETQTR